MKRVFALSLLLLMVISMLPACKGEPPPPPAPPPAPPPPPPTPEEIEAEIRNSYQKAFDAIWAAGGVATAEVKDKLIATLKQNAQKHKATEWGQGGLKRVANTFELKIKEARDAKQWDNVFFACDCLEALEPDHEILKRNRDLAFAQKTRPRVAIKGTFEQNGQTVWFLDVFLPATGKTESGQWHEGDEFHGLRFVRVLGDNRSIELEYLALQEMFTVKAP